jgi:hypothetical protein
MGASDTGVQQEKMKSCDTLFFAQHYNQNTMGASFPSSLESG